VCMLSQLVSLAYLPRPGLRIPSSENYFCGVTYSTGFDVHG